MLPKIYKKIHNYHFDTNEPIGQGSFGTVYIAYEGDTEENKLAVKVIPLTLLKDPKLEDMCLREIAILKQLKGEHIVQLKDVRRSDRNLYIFMDYCDGGTLEEKVKVELGLTEPQICSIIKQIAEAFITLNEEGHQITIMHRDIKLQNVMFHQGKVKLTDFGFAKSIEDINRSARMGHSLLGTPSYMCPQILNDEPYSAKCDVWSAGILMYRLLYGIQPWSGKGDQEVYQKIISQPLEFPVSTTPEIEDLLRKMLKADEKERLSWKEVYDHPALKPY